MDIRIINPDNIELKGIALQYFNAVNNGLDKIPMYNNFKNDYKDLTFIIDNTNIKFQRIDKNTYKVI